MFLREQQELDDDIYPALLWVKDGSSRPPWREAKSFSPALRALYQQFESLVLHNDVLYRIFYNVDSTEILSTRVTLHS